MRAILMLSVALAGCTVSVDFDEFRFPEGPCGPVRTTCPNTGEATQYIVFDQDVGRYTMDEPRRVPGFDLDYNEDAVCGHADEIAPDGGRGIDNQLGPLLTVLESTPMGINIREAFVDSILDGSLLQIYEVSKIDDFMNDDCVKVRIGRALVPRGISEEMIMEYLDSDGDRIVDDGITLDIAPESATDEDACIRDGELFALPTSSTIALPGADGGTAELDVSLPQTRARISRDALSEGVQGGGFSVEQLTELIRPGDPTGALGNIIRNDADLIPVDGECSLISIGLTFEAKSFVLGSRI